MPDCVEIATSVLQPHFDAARDAFVAYKPAAGHGGLKRLARVRFMIDPAAHDTERHFAATSDTGMLQVYAPEVVDLPFETLVAIVTHEMGHSADFAYPGAWTWPRAEAGPSNWVGETTEAHARAWRGTFGKPNGKSARAGDDSPPALNWMLAWRKRTADQVEWAADGIAFAVTGQRIGYAGNCMLQTFDPDARSRPRGLR